MAEPISGSAGNSTGSWLFFGAKALVAKVNSRLSGLLEASVAVLGEKVVVAMARTGKEDRQPILLCRPCAETVLHRVNPPSQQYYGWDWLAELEPKRPESRASMRQKLSRVTRHLMPTAGQ